MLYGLDIETNTKGRAWPPESGLMTNGERKGLDPRYTHIISVAVSAEDDVFFDDGKEADILRNLNDWFAARSPGTIVTWNGANFDIPFLVTRSAKTGVPLDLRTQVSALRPPKYRICPGHGGGLVAAWGAHDHVDLMYAYKEYAEENGIRQGLKPVTAHLGLNPIEVDATQMELLSKEELRAYNTSDVVVTRKAGELIDLTPWRDSLILAHAA